MSTETAKQAVNDASQYFTADIPDNLKKLFENALERALENKQRLKKQLLKEAESKNPKFFHQIDGFTGCHPDDCYMPGDKNGDAFTSGSSWELKNSTNEVRLLVHEDSKPADVLRLLKKIRKLVKSNPEMITDKGNRNGMLENAGRDGEQNDEFPF